MTQFKDFDDVFDPLVLPIRGKEYTIPPVTFQAGAVINEAFSDPKKLQDEPFYRLLLSDALFDEMVADGLPVAAIDRVARTALTDFKQNREMALIMWETGGDPKAVQEYLKKNTPNWGLAALEEYGRGEKDPITGLYEWYETPDEVLAPSVPVTWPMFFEAWPLLVADFRSEYGIHLERAAHDPRFTWREFAFYATGLLSADTRINRRFAPRNDD